MKPSATLALSALLSLVIAQPLVEKRDDDTTITVTDVVVVVTDVTITVGPSPGPAVATSKHANHIAYHAQGKAEAQAQPPPPSSSPAPVQQPPVQQKNAVPPPPPSSTPAAAAGSSPEQIQEAEDAKQEAVNNQQKQADFAHQSQMIAQQNGGNTEAPAVQAPAPPSPTPQAPAQSQPQPPSSGSGSTGGSSGPSGSYSGDVTIYNDQGTGACGWSNDTNSEDFFALAHGMFGDYTNNAPGPNKNAFCGRMANIFVDGKSFSGMLTDKCGGCDGQSIDLSQHLFSQLYPNEPPGNGRYHNVPWEFTSGPIYSPA